MNNANLKTELERILPQLRAYARSRVPNIEDADDLVSKTCIRILERQDKYNPVHPLIAWAIQIMKNISIDDYRKFKSVEKRLEPAGSIEASNPDMLIDVSRLIYELPIEQREVLMLSGIGYRYKEIAEYLNIPQGTVMSRLKRGRDALFTLMYAEGEAS